MGHTENTAYFENEMEVRKQTSPSICLHYGKHLFFGY